MQKRIPSPPKKSHSTDRKQEYDSPQLRKRKNSRDQNPKVLLKLGICAMRKKIQAKPMQEILNRLKCPEFQIIIIDDAYWEMNQKNWPAVDALICFYSDGFPYLKAWKYVESTRPFLINDLDKQQLLWDRTLVYAQLKKYNIPTAKNYFVCRQKETIKDFYKKRYCDLDESQNISHKQHIKQLLQKTNDSTDCTNQKGGQSSTNSQNNLGLTNLGLIRRQSKNEDERRNRNSSTQRPQSRQKSHNLPSFQQQRQKVQTQTYSKRLSFGHLRNPVTYLQSYFDKITYQNYEIKQMQDDSIMIGPHKLKKPFVQKPFDAENHDVCIYYPESDGGGCKFLYRKKVNSCSQFNPSVNSIRSDGNYIYQQFLRTNGFDIKVYTVGPYYMHAQARKAPSLDGVVQRNEYGKQKRYPIVLTPQQKFIAQKVVQVFQQYVCGFDLLRSNGKSYVCDVNGWSFVKGNPKYYDDCASILKQIIFQKFFPTKINQLTSPLISNFRNITPNRFVPTTQQMMLQSNPEELRSIVAIFRHGDRSPKQKMKLTVTEPAFLSFFKSDIKQVKVKDPKSLTNLLNITNQILSTMQYQINQKFLKLVQMKSVLEIGGHFDGLNRKVQFKAIDFGPDPKDPTKKVVTTAVLILKWGGGLTNSGKKDAIQLGKYFRSTYSNQQGFLSLHSSYRHDLKTYSSDQGRCLQTAAAFLKGFLDLEGDLIPIINSMINRDKRAQLLLDMTQQTQCIRKVQTAINDQISDILNSDIPVQQSISKKCDLKQCSTKYVDAIKKLKKPREKLQQLYQYVKELTASFAELASTNYYLNQQDVTSKPQNQSDENSQVLIYKRWYKHEKDFYNHKIQQYNISKIPDIYDSIKYDMIHNRQLLQKLYPNYQILYKSAQVLAYFVVPSQYGMTTVKKLEIAQKIVAPLCKKVFNDLMFWKGQKNNQEQQYWKYKQGVNKKQWRHVRTRLYFTSSSHIYSIFYILALGNKGLLVDSCQAQVGQRIKNINYIGYLSHIDLRLYENLRVQENDKHRFRLQLNFSPRYQLYNPSLNTKLMIGHSGFTIEEIQTFFKTVLGEEWNKQDI